VDILKIHAAYENNVLQVMLPFNELSHGYHKNVEIYHS
jgi:hypothetical protein